MFESSNEFMFHVSNVINRESIRKHGLNSSGPTQWTEDVFPKGNYLFSSLKEARRYGFGNGDPFDIWKVDISKYKLVDDPITKGAFFVSENIEPTDLHLEESHEKDVMNVQEGVIEPSKKPKTMSFWHGGNLDDLYDESMSHRAGHWEYGPGLYLTTSYNVVQKYARGSRKLYMVTVEKGTDLEDVDLSMEKIEEFATGHLSATKRKVLYESIKRIKQRKNEDHSTPLNAEYLLNIIINEKLLPSSKSGEIRKFFVRNGIDYHIERNAFGWGETMLVLYNMRKAIGIKRVHPGDEIEQFDLPTKFLNENESEHSYTAYRGEQGGRKNTGSGIFFTDTYDVAMYFANDNPKKVKQYSLTFKNPLLLKSNKVTSFDDVTERAKSTLSQEQMADLINFNNENAGGTTTYRYDSKTDKMVLVGTKKNTNVKEITIDILAKWTFANTNYDGLIIDNIEEADDLRIVSTTYICKKSSQAKIK